MREAVTNMMSNPQMLEDMMNPQNLQAIMQMQSAMQQLQSSGLFPGLPVPGASPGAAAGAGMGAGAGAAGLGDMGAMLSQLMGGGMAGGLGGMGGLGGLGGFAAPPAVADPETAYASQLQQLQDMGFFDRQANIAALQATGGNVNAAVERLL